MVMMSSPATMAANNQKVAQFLANLLATIRIAHIEHYNTRSYARHKALDKYYKKMPELADTMTEAFLGACDITIPQPNIPPTISNFEVALETVCKTGFEIHKNMCPSIQNPLENILTQIQQTKYLLKLK